MRVYTCFFVTPMGDEGSDIRENSNNVMDTFMFPALTQHGFTVQTIKRSDHLHGENIAIDMKKHLEDDDLCIVDITGNNINVMYEFGYRRGLGKPLILLKDKNDQTKLPFDIQDERIIKYDLSSPNAIKNIPVTRKVLSDRVESIVKDGFVNPSGSGSVSDIYQRLNVIEKKLNDVLSKSTVSTEITDISDRTSSIISELGSPIQAFNYALRTRDVQLAEDLLPRIESSFPKKRFIDQAVSLVAAMGSENAAKILHDEWDWIKDNLSFKQQYEEFGCFVSYCNISEKEIEYLEFLESEANALLEKATTDEEKAGIYNQINRFFYGAHSTINRNGKKDTEYLDKAIDAQKEATRLNPNEPSFFYNLAICCQEKETLDDAVEAINRCLDLETSDVDHLSLAYKLYTSVGDVNKASEVKKTLKKINPRRAMLLG